VALRSELHPVTAKSERRQTSEVANRLIGIIEVNLSFVKVRVANEAAKTRGTGGERRTAAALSNRVAAANCHHNSATDAEERQQPGCPRRRRCW